MNIRKAKQGPLFVQMYAELKGKGEEENLQTDDLNVSPQSIAQGVLNFFIKIMSFY